MQMTQLDRTRIILAIIFVCIQSQSPDDWRDGRPSRWSPVLLLTLATLTRSRSSWWWWLL